MPDRQVIYPPKRYDGSHVRVKGQRAMAVAMILPEPKTREQAGKQKGLNLIKTSPAEQVTIGFSRDYLTGSRRRSVIHRDPRLPGSTTTETMGPRLQSTGELVHALLRAGNQGHQGVHR